MSREANIPVIDISESSSETAQRVLDAASTHGFLFIKNDGLTIAPADIAAMFAESRTFFQQPSSEKAKYAIHTSAAGKNKGWVRFEGETLDPGVQTAPDPKEAFNIAPPHPTLQPLPPTLTTAAPLITRFQSSCHTLCLRILALLNIALRIPDPDYLTKCHDLRAGPSGTILRLLYYPQTSSSDRIRAGAHSDYGSVTLLFRQPGEAGLELRKDDGTWAGVPVNPNPEDGNEPPILVNIGDALAFWTKGLLKSTVHRVTFSGGQERYSIAYFCHPLDEVRLEPVESEVIERYGEQGREELERQRRNLGLAVGDGTVLTAAEHLTRRLEVTYNL